MVSIANHCISGKNNQPYSTKNAEFGQKEKALFNGCCIDILQIVPTVYTYHIVAQMN